MARFSARNLDAVLTRLLAAGKESAREAAQLVRDPPFLRAKADGATRVGQWTAALTMPIIVIVSLALLTAFNGVLASVFGAGGDLAGGQSAIVAFLVTAITLGAFALVAYAWFQYVRTAGFGMFTMED